MQNNNIFQFSYFKNCKAKLPQKTISLESFVKEIKDGTHKNSIEALRAMTGEAEQREAKKKLQAATISGTFSHRLAERLLQHSHIICLDFDDLSNPAGFRQQVAALPFVLAAFISPRGSGCKVLAHSAGNDHLNAFISLQTHFLAITGQRADDSGKDVSRLCFISHDQEVYYNPQATPFEPATAAPPPALASMRSEGMTNIPGDPDVTRHLADQEAEVLYLIEKIEARQIDVTDSNYKTWLEYVVFPFAHFFRGNGFPFLHRVSRFSSKYSIEVTDNQFREALKQRKDGRKIESFFQLCKEKGIYAKDGSEAARSTTLPTITPQHPEQRKIPMIAQVEQFLKARFTFRRNVVNEKIEALEKGKHHWNEVNENAISRLLEHNFFNYGPNKTASLPYSDFVEPHNPFTQYFSSLKYNPDEGSYIDKVCQMVKAKDQPRFNRHFRKMLIRCVACSTVEEKTNSRFNKHIFTLVSPKQSVGKTSFTRWLCPPALNDYYTETFDSSKDGKISLATMFMINLDELASLAKHDINQLKALVSLGSINERLPYGKHRQFYPRRANFFGSTNSDEFLTDTTGNVRWLCFEILDFEQGFWKTGSTNFIDINRVWAEAKYYFDKGESYQLTADEKGENEAANEAHRRITLEEELIRDFCRPDPNQLKENHRTATQVMNELILKSALASKINRDVLSKALITCGFERKQVKIDNNPRYGYFIII